MSKPPDVVPAIHDWHLKQVLISLGLDQAIAAGAASCARCHRPVGWDNLGGILVRGNKQFAVVCDQPECLAGEQRVDR